jgi:hypothetical protein
LDKTSQEFLHFALGLRALLPMGCSSSSHVNNGVFETKTVQSSKLCDDAQLNELKGGTLDHYFNGLQSLSGKS